MRIWVGDVRLFFEVFGEEWVFTGDGFERRPVVIGLHGGPGLDGTKLRYQLQPLADVAQVVVPDQRGHGRSDRGSPESWRLSTWADDVKGLADALAIERPVVLGVSFGGGVALRYAGTYAGDPAGLILVSTSLTPPTTEEVVERFREVGGDEAAEVHRRDVEAPSEESAAEWVRVCYPLLSRRPEPDPLLEKLEAWRFEHQSRDVNLHHSRRAKEADLAQMLRAVRCPTLVLIGELDPLVSIRAARTILDAMPKAVARLEPIPDASHDLLADAPTQTFTTIAEFLAELR